MVERDRMKEGSPVSGPNTLDDAAGNTDYRTGVVKIIGLLVRRGIFSVFTRLHIEMDSVNFLTLF